MFYYSIDYLKNDTQFIVIFSHNTKRRHYVNWGFKVHRQKLLSTKPISIIMDMSARLNPIGDELKVESIAKQLFQQGNNYIVLKYWGF